MSESIAREEEEEEKKKYGGAARRWRTRWRSRLGRQAGAAWSRETQARSSSVGPYPPARPGYLCHLSSAPGYLLASVLLLYALFRHMLNARSRVQARVSHLCTKGEERRRKLAAFCYILRAPFPSPVTLRESRDREEGKRRMKNVRQKRDFVS